MTSRTWSAARDYSVANLQDPAFFIHFSVEYINTRYDIRAKKDLDFTSTMEMLWDCYKNGTAAFPSDIEKGKISLIWRNGTEQVGEYLKSVGEIEEGGLYNITFEDQMMPFEFEEDKDSEHKLLNFSDCKLWLI